mgnify:CR=1 FL=1
MKNTEYENHDQGTKRREGGRSLGRRRPVGNGFLRCSKLRLRSWVVEVQQQNKNIILPSELHSLRRLVHIMGAHRKKAALTSGNSGLLEEEDGSPAEDASSGSCPDPGTVFSSTTGPEKGGAGSELPRRPRRLQEIPATTGNATSSANP